MKFSMWMLQDELEKHWTIQSSIQRGRCEIIGILWKVDCEPTNEEFAYIGSPVQFAVEETALCVVFHKGDYICVDAQPEIVSNTLVAYYFDILKFEERLKSACLAEHPFQEIADLMYKITAHPVTINDNYFHVLGLAGKMVGDNWEYMKQHRVSPPQFLGRYIYEDSFHVYMTGHTPTLRRLPPYALWKASLRINFFFDHVAMCRMSISLPDTNVSKGFVHFVEQAGSVIEQMPIERVHQLLMEDIVDAATILEEGGEIDTENTVYQQIEGHLGNSPFYLCRLTADCEVLQKTLFYWFCGRLMALFPNSYSFPYKDQVILLISAENISKEKFHTFAALLEQTSFFCAVSNRANSLTYLSSCYKQTEHFIFNGNPRYPRIYFFEDHASDYLIKEIASQKDWQLWLPCGIFDLEEHDQEYHTSYISTLKCLVKNNFILTKTADDLYIHRNSLQYRLTKMGEIMGYDLSDPQNRFYLSLSAKLYFANKPECPSSD